MRAMQNLVIAEAQRQQEIIEVEKAYQNKIKMYALLGGLIVLLLVAAMFYRNSVNQKKSRILLQQQKNELEQSLRQLRTTQTQLVQAEKMASLGELTAGIAHEIQNPLNFVNNFSEVSTELVKEMVQEVDKGNTDEVKAIANDVVQNIEKINHHGQRAADIVKGMLQHSRSSSGVKEPTDINALCDEYLRLSYHGLRAKDKSFNAEFATKFDTALAAINVVPQDIGRVILNLINNAFYAVNERQKNEKDSGYKPRVTLTTKKQADQVVIEVADNGTGMPEQIKEKIFQPFFTTKPTGEGTGLGLSLSYDIVTKGHGGTIEVETTEGIGTKFIISLPV
jgi:signal transduction histidine kinase